jgi:DNA-binding LytR/AlgR family response regulator
MVRCHRSYIVNINKIRFLEEERRLHYLALDDDSIRRIPVSKSYYNTLVAIISPKKQQTQVVTPETEA